MDWYVTTIPLVHRLATLLDWTLVVNAIAVGMIVYFALIAAKLARRVHELEDELARLRHEPQPPLAEPPSLTRWQDDKHIPITEFDRHDA